MPQTPKLNDFTAEELAEARTKALAEREARVRRCKYCGVSHSMRPDQLFCSAKCRSSYHREALQLAHENLLREREAWLAERQELVGEIARLREEMYGRINGAKY